MPNSEVVVDPEGFTIERLHPPASEHDLNGLAELLLDAIGAGAAVSFLDSLDQHHSLEWWRTTLESSHDRAIFLLARADDRIAGSVQLQPVWAPNQPDRGEVVKLLVHRSFRRRGLGSALMRRLEHEAQNAMFRILTLDAKRGAEAERLYRALGWIEVGVIPRFAYDPNGWDLHDAVLFYKELPR